MKKKTDEIAELKRWASLPENSLVKIAYLLGYRTEDTIKKWIRNNHIPMRERERVKAIINSK